MPRITMNCHSAATERSSGDVGVPEFISRMTCSCAETTAGADAPMARALFHRVEVLKHPPELAARALGLEPGDAAYLLTGLREEVAKDLARVLLAERPAREIADQKETDDE